MTIQWFPGHMLKTQRLIEEYRSKVDLFLEVADARAPFSTTNPLLDKLMASKPRIVVLNKSDLADPYINGRWKRYFDALPGRCAVLVSCKERKNLSGIFEEARRLCRSKKWFSLRKIRMMIVGVPNVGKSTLINALSKTHKAQVAPQPGHTKGPQRISLGERFDLVDTPGILWHKFDDPEVGVRLAFLAAIKDQVCDTQELCFRLFLELDRWYPKLCLAYFGKIFANWRTFELGDEKENPEIMDEKRIGSFLSYWAQSRGMLKKSRSVDWNRVEQTFLTDFRTGKIGRVSLERPSS